METAVNEVDVYKALRAIVANRKQPAVNYAVNYALQGLSMSGHELKVQVLYVLNNISHWRGDVAKQTRDTLKAYTKNMYKGR
jgi:hypothetical protein